MYAVSMIRWIEACHCSEEKMLATLRTCTFRLPVFYRFVDVQYDRPYVSLSFIASQIGCVALVAQYMG